MGWEGGQSDVGGSGAAMKRGAELATGGEHSAIVVKGSAPQALVEGEGCSSRGAGIFV